MSGDVSVLACVSLCDVADRQDGFMGDCEGNI